ncbi:CPBP family intramembrane glutamic endopeptidase [Muriicola sp. Z0-33]|uniref:CPBP family intramembrane glutamic endopeptidase n=1 Tax=Muriicola sp. Z0-33 TaxID=2816957 RepID=UPI00223862CD|nr:CPBP family intramembrane glutamic endopeptidase [Muriicola sp. Z0-33]MCW5515432.1 CPBP family intramembrane metalloprotease [Muriicola sp. Z0-33]
MEAKIKNVPAEGYSWLFCLREMLLVFLPAFLFVKLTSSWAGEDIIRGFVVIWGANLMMLAMIWTSMKLRGQTWQELGLTFKSVNLKQALIIIGQSLLVFVFGVGCFILGSVIVANISGIPESADFSNYEFLKDNLGGLILSLAGVYFISSFGEEVIYRAFLINRLTEMTRSFKYSKHLAVLISAIFFGLIHYEWGAMGMVQTGFMGLAMGVSYLVLKKRLWVLILAHIYMDTLLFVQLYLASN